MVVGGQHVINKPLIARDRITLPPLHIKLDLKKQFVKALNKDSSCVEHVAHKLPRITMEKTEGRNFRLSTDQTIYKLPTFHSINE
jgi:hypothetical protein